MILKDVQTTINIQERIKNWISLKSPESKCDKIKLVKVLTYRGEKCVIATCVDSEGSDEDHYIPLKELDL